MERVVSKKPWACSRCTFLNVQALHKCEMCLSPRIPHKSTTKPVAQTQHSLCHGKRLSVNQMPSENTNVTRLTFRVEEGATPLVNGVSFRVWAPKVVAVSVAGCFNEWNPTSHVLIREGSSDYFSGVVSNVLEYQSYLYVFFSNSSPARWMTDPYSRFLTVPSSHFPAAPTALISTVISPDFHWNDRNFSCPPHNLLVLYQLCVHTFSSAGTFEGAISRLPHLKELGVNCIEMLPHTQDIHSCCWGYDPVSLFAVDHNFGTPNDLKRLVNECHRLGIAVIFDWVPNHLHNQNVLQFFGGEPGLYFDPDRSKQETPFGPRLSLSHPNSRKYITSSLRMWFQEYHFDGVRVDSTVTLRRLKPVENGDPDLVDAWTLMQECTDLVKREFPGRLLIAEDLQNSLMLTTACAGFHSQWDPKFFFAIYQACIAGHDNQRDVNTVAHAIATTFTGTCTDRVIFTENHDTVPTDRQDRFLSAMMSIPNAKREHSVKRTLVAFGLMLTSPGIPMMLQGQEYLEERSGTWPTPPLTDPSAPTTLEQLRVFHVCCLMIRARVNANRQSAGLGGNHQHITHVNQGAGVVIFHRWHHGGPADDVMVVANLSSVRFASYQFGVPRPGTWNILFHSEWDLVEGEIAMQRVEASSGFYDGFPFVVDVALDGYSIFAMSQHVEQR
eukprot:c9150_g1_i1.p1 GENE.c9150_g1_i1~~c9150_g1_i1.p1  ORF type:complete len:668 (+),score=106.37 c9150_g1_i1:51-2054(+)